MTRLLGAIACALVLGTIAAPTANADDVGRPTQFCESTYLCVWWDSHYGGSRYIFGGNNSSWHSWAIADDDSSTYNNGTSGLRAAVYTSTSGTGTRIVCLPMGSWASHHSPNDSGSSNYWLSAC